MPTVLSVSSFRRHVDEWMRMLAALPPMVSVAEQEIEELVISVFKSLPHWLDVRSLDERIAAWRTFDPTDVAFAVELLRSAPRDPFRLRDDALNGDAYLDQVQASMADLGRFHGDDRQGRFGPDLDMLDHNLEYALMDVADTWDPVGLVDRVHRRIEGLADSALRKIWAAILRECYLETEPPHQPSVIDTLSENNSEDEMGFWVGRSRVVPHQFFTPQEISAAELRARIAKYTAWYRSRLYREAIRRGRRRFPTCPPLGLVRALSLKLPSGLREPNEAERMLSRTLGCLCAITSESTTLFRMAEIHLSLDQRGPTLRTEVVASKAGLPRDRYLLLHLSQLLWACEELQLGDHPPLWQLLNRYKLRLELSSSEVVRDLGDLGPTSLVSEIALQRDICRFLLVHGVQGVGTKIGRSETDIVVSERSELHLLEVKLYQAAPTASQLVAHLPQVSTYRQDFMRPPETSSLVVFNRSPTLLVGPPRLVVGDCLIVFINLMEARASERRHQREFYVEKGQLMHMDTPRETRSGQSRTRTATKRTHVGRRRSTDASDTSSASSTPPAAASRRQLRAQPAASRRRSRT